VGQGKEEIMKKGEIKSDFADLRGQLQEAWDVVNSSETDDAQRRVPALELAWTLLDWENEQPPLPGFTENGRLALWLNVAETAGLRLEAVRAAAGEKKQALRESIADQRRKIDAAKAEIDAAEAAAETLCGENKALQREIDKRQTEIAALNTRNQPLVELKATLEAERRDIAQILELHARLQDECAALTRAEENLREGNGDDYLRCFHQAAESLREIQRIQDVWHRSNETIAGALAALPFPEELRAAGAALARAAAALRESDQHLGTIVREQGNTDAKTRQLL
jgi:chromosome segregation ATPase